MPQRELALALWIDQPGGGSRGVCVAKSCVRPGDLQRDHRAFADKDREFVERELAPDLGRA